MFWYAIEKLFEIGIGISPPQIVTIGLVAETSKILIELPTSIIADRWSRRNLLVAANTILLFAVALLGLSHNFTMYLVATLVWSVSDALTSGTYQAFIYDSIAEATGETKIFSRLYPRLLSFEMVTTAAAGIASSVISSVWSLQATYFLSLIPVFIGLVTITKMREPVIKRSSDLGLSVLHHAKDTLRTIARPAVRWVSTMYLIITGLTIVWYEFYQLLAIEVHVPEHIFGAIIGFMTIGVALGSELARKLPRARSVIVVLWAAFATISLGFLRANNWLVIIAAIFSIAIAGRALQIYMEVYLHSQTQSAYRATIISTLTTLSYAVFFVLALVFNVAIHHFSARTTMTLVTLPILMLATIDVVRRVPWANQKV